MSTANNSKKPSEPPSTPASSASASRSENAERWCLACEAEAAKRIGGYSAGLSPKIV